MNNDYKIDEMDRKILSFLVKDARMAFLEIARECGVSGAAIHQRVKKLEESGIITGYSALVKPAALGLPVCAFVMTDISEANKFNDVVSALKKISEVVECHFVTGQASILLKVFCKDYDHLMEVILNNIQKIPAVASTETMISLKEPFQRQVWVNPDKPKTASKKSSEK